MAFSQRLSKVKTTAGKLNKELHVAGHTILTTISSIVDNNLQPQIKISLNNCQTSALLDTGASHSFIDKKFCETSSILNNQISVYLVNDKIKLNTLGTVKLLVKIQNLETPITFHVLDSLTENVILGRDWLRSNNAILDFVTSCIYLGSNNRITIFWQNSQHSEIREMEPLSLQQEQVHAPNAKDYLELITTFSDIFKEDLRQPTTTLVEHFIKLKDDSPFQLRRYQYSSKKREIIHEEVQKMLTAGVIRSSQSSYCSPVVIVEKKKRKTSFLC